MFRPTGQWKLGFSWMRKSWFSSVTFTARKTSRRVICSGSLSKEAPPTPGRTSTKPAFFNMPIILLMTTGFVFTLLAIKSPVQSFGLRAIRERVWTAMEKRVLICFKSLTTVVTILVISVRKSQVHDAQYGSVQTKRKSSANWGTLCARSIARFMNAASLVPPGTPAGRASAFPGSLPPVSCC